MGEGKITLLTKLTAFNRQSLNIAHVIARMPHLVTMAPGVTFSHTV